MAEGERADLAQLQEAWEGAIEGVFPYRTPANATLPEVKPQTWLAAEHNVRARGVHRLQDRAPTRDHPGLPRQQLRVRTPPGAFTEAGAEADVFVINNLTPEAVAQAPTSSPVASAAPKSS